ncbi:MAG TPA: hypothetical protein PK020_06755 [Ilumatobacteraceae bacterium]|nr:hypothetical protein [Ilumatobacteraceae bacterium]
MKHSTRRGRRSAGDQVVEDLKTADRFPVGDPRRSAAQRRVARRVADDISVADDPRLAGMRAQLRQWAHFAPHLLSDEQETALAREGRAVVDEQLQRLRSLETESATSLSAADDALRNLDAEASADRQHADIATHAVTDLRAPLTASVLGTLAACHLADDRLRSIDDWRTRFAVVQGTTPATLAALRDATHDARGLAAQWWSVRSGVVGGEYCDRRVGLPAPAGTLEAHSRAAAAALARAVPSLADTARHASGRIVHGADNQVVIEADGRISVTVAHRPTPRGSLMVAHEIGHALHALESASPEPPGALVGETIACWASFVTGQCGVDDSQSAAMALALGDTLVEELFISAAVSAFEDSVYELAAGGRPISVAQLDAAWLHANRDVLSGVVVPDLVGSGWARLPALATDPGHAFSYVWATVLALAISTRHGSDENGTVARAIRAGGVAADEFTALLGFDGDEWIALGLSSLEAELTHLAHVVSASQ